VEIPKKKQYWIYRRPTLIKIAFSCPQTTSYRTDIMHALHKSFPFSSFAASETSPRNSALHCPSCQGNQSSNLSTIRFLRLSPMTPTRFTVSADSVVLAKGRIGSAALDNTKLLGDRHTARPIGSLLGEVLEKAIRGMNESQLKFFTGT
jgi:hypothetical protein